MSHAKLMDAQDSPGNGGDQSPAGLPPKGDQTSLRVYARDAGSTPTDQSPSEESYHVLSPQG